MVTWISEGCPLTIFQPKEIHNCLAANSTYPEPSQTYKTKNTDNNPTSLLVLGDSRYRQFTQALEAIYNQKIKSFDKKSKMPFGNSLFHYHWFNLLASMKTEYDFKTMVSKNRWISHVEKMIDYIKLKKPKFVVIGPTILHAIMFSTK